ncbi:oligosaccharide flippase family protein [Actinoplanes sp. HUAS TT8]|uniref:oligosaccharide flippase family protein n=1 Tax=Actinoplanes sp. HUAS TT8 TaxID=3447453 RepID=UPI003F5236DE
MTVSNLQAKVASAARWSVLNTVVVRIGNFAAGVILARFFLSPYDFGLYAVGAVMLAVLLSANEMGVSLAVIRWEGDVRRFAPTVLSLSTLSSLVLYLSLYFAAPFAATALGSPAATDVLRVLCLTVVIDGIACVPAGLLTREFRQGPRMVIDLLIFVVSTSVTMVLAVQGQGAMSFAWGAVAGNLVGLAATAVAAPGMLRFGWDRKIAVRLLRFGLPLAGASLLVLAMVNVDSLVVGAALGPVALGFYQIAVNMSGWPVRTISEAARRVSFAGFSRIADDTRSLASGYASSLSVLMAVAVPACVLLGTLAEPLIRAVYGDQWAPAAAALRFLAALGLIRVGYELTYDCLVAAGHRKLLMGVQALWLAALVPILIGFVHPFGIAGVAAGHVVVGVLVVIPVFLWALARVGIAPRVVAGAVGRPFLGGIAVGVTGWSVFTVVGHGFAGLVVAGLAALLVYVPFVLPLLRRLRPVPAAPAVPEPVEAGI